jgi:hypothetical protein
MSDIKRAEFADSKPAAVEKDHDSVVALLEVVRPDFVDGRAQFFDLFWLQSYLFTAKVVTCNQFGRMDIVAEV